MDTVHDINDEVEVQERDGMFWAFDYDMVEQYGVGGDDKVGIWATILALNEFDNISAAFFVQEEIGCIGSNNADMSQFRNANWIAQLDRRGHEDFIVSDMASAEFIEDMTPLVDKYNLEVTKQSTVTDVYKLVSNGAGVSGVNIASGYYRPHTKTEVVSYGICINSLELLFDMIRDHGGKKFKHKIKRKKKGYNGGYKNGQIFRSKHKGGKTKDNPYRYSDGREFYYEHGMPRERVLDYNLGLYEVFNGYGLFLHYEDLNGNVVRKDNDKSIKTYHNFEAELAEHKSDIVDISDELETEAEAAYDKYNEDVTNLESALFLFGFTLYDFKLGLVEDDFVKNISAHLYLQHGVALDYYEELFGIQGMYPDAAWVGSYTPINKHF